VNIYVTFINVSRIGKKPIQIPTGVEVSIQEGGRFSYKEVKVKGPNGEISTAIKRDIDVKIEGTTLSVEKVSNTKQGDSFFGLYRTLIQNMVDGVVTPFKKHLEIVGIGYRAEMQGTKIILSVGYSHKINFEPPQGITISVVDQVNIAIEGIDKQMVGEVAAKLRAFRKPEPYKGKGIRYKGEVIRKKSTKSAS